MALLENLGLPSAFLGWIAVLYRKADAAIRIGDVYTKAFLLFNESSTWPPGWLSTSARYACSGVAPGSMNGLSSGNILDDQVSDCLWLHDQPPGKPSPPAPYGAARAINREVVYLHSWVVADKERVFLDSPHLQAQEVLEYASLGRCKENQGVVFQLMPKDPTLQVRGPLDDGEGHQDDWPDMPTGPVANGNVCVSRPSGWDNDKKISILYENLTTVKPDDNFTDVIIKPLTRKIDGVKGAGGSEGVLQNFFNSLLHRKTGAGAAGATLRTTTSKQLRILQCNINGLCSTATKIKLEEIMEIAEKQKIQIIALQETKLNEKCNLKYKNYNILRKDRNKEGGGLAFLIKNLYYEDIAINIPNTSDLEAQGIKVYHSQNKTINIFNMYHPPNNKLIDDGTMAQFLTDNTIIVGDLNAKHQLWGCSMPNPRGKILSNLFDDNAFMCLNDGNPTHHSYSYNTAQALDISFSSPDIFHKCKWQILKSIGSDHLPILIEISTKTKTSSIKEKFWNFKKANWNLYQQNTNEDFRKAPTRIKDLEQNWISFKNTIIKAAKVSIPRGNIKKWIPNYTHQAKDIQTLITKRNELQKKCTQNQTNCRTELNIVNAKIKSTHNIFHEKINMKELDYALENTDLNKTPGPDGIHGQMISNLGKNGKERLLDIFNNSWKTGKLPQDWKTATIIPIKKLDKSADDPKNYRPISLTSICCKLMEKIILRRLTYHLDTKNLLPEEQYGFRKGHGTIDQLLFFTQK
ncbi:hypothetical protein LAZ67_22000235, partial [Cordylochernes scorpioides]